MLYPLPAIALSQTSYFSLSEAIAAATWNPENRGPLLFIPGEGRSGGSTHLTLPLGVPEAAAAFDQQVVRCGSLTVVAPLYQISTPLRPSVSFGGGSEGSPLMALLDQLDDSQLQKLGSRSGLGRMELSSPEQRELFEKLVPNPLRYRKATSHGNGYSSNDVGTVLSPQERLQVRLHLERRTEINLLGPAEGSRMRKIESQGTRPYGTTFFVASSFRERLREPSSAPPTPRLPNRLKPTALAFDMPKLNAAISLDGAKTVGELVERCAKASGLEIYADLDYGKLPCQLRAAPRTRVRAGDVLKALCWSLQATMRQLEPTPVFVLVADQEGIAVQMARLNLANREKSRKTSEERAERDQRLAKRNALRHFPFAPGDILGEAGALRQQFENASPLTEGQISYGGLVLPFKSAPVSLQKQIQEGLVQERARSQESQRMRAEISARIVERGGSPLPVDIPQPEFIADKVQLTPRYDFEFLLANGTAVQPELSQQLRLESSSTIRVQASFPPLPTTTPFVVPAPLSAQTTLLIAPKTEQVARQLITQAAQQGFSHVWIEVDDALAPLDAALQTGKALGVQIGAVLSLLRSSDPTLPPSARDLTLFGDDGTAGMARAKQQDLWQSLYDTSRDPWLAPGDTATHARLVRRLSELAKRKDLSCLVFTDTTPPGYTLDAGSFFQVGYEFGYTLENRLAFLRKNSRDPLDITLSLGSLTVSTPRSASFSSQTATPPSQTATPPPPSPGALWIGFRSQQRKTFLLSTYQQVRERFAQLPLFFCATPLDWFGTWESAERLPQRTSRTVSADQLSKSQLAHQLSKVALLPILYRPGALNKPRPQGTRPAPLLPDGPTALAYTLHEALTNDSMQEPKSSEWDGLVIDLRSAKNEQLAELLTGVVVSKPGKL